MKFSTTLALALVFVGACKGASEDAVQPENLAGTGGTTTTTTTTTTGTGGTGAAPGSTSATWIPTLATSVNGWVKAAGGATQAYQPGQTATASAADGTTAVCSVLYGPSNVLSCSGALSCTWLSTDRNVLASKHGQTSSNDAYLSSQQGAADAASDALSCTLAGASSCSSEYIWRGTTGLGALPLEDAQGGITSTQFQIACAVMAPSFQSFIYSPMADNVSADGDVALTAELDAAQHSAVYGVVN